jgi:hypothetical protein
MITITEAEMTAKYDLHLEEAVESTAIRIEKGIKNVWSKGVYTYCIDSKEVEERVIAMFRENGFSIYEEENVILWGEPKRKFDKDHKRSDPPGDE